MKLEANEELPVAEISPPRVETFVDLINRNDVPALSIDNYQRGFIWGEDKVRQLIRDLQDYWKSSKQAKTPAKYYMGTVLLHRHENMRFIIDGQQRLTALSILYWCINKKLPPKIDLTYRSVDSIRNVRQAKDCFLAADDLHSAELFDCLCFTVIEVPSEDLAFAFFDTQNNRGVPPDAIDLLKAYHLRAIKGDGGDQALEINGARRWEALQLNGPIPGLPGAFAPVLFDLFLWRARQWRGPAIVDKSASRDALLKEFQERTRKPMAGAAAIIPLHATRNNRLSRSLVLCPSGDCELETLPIKVSHRPAELPFALRQPITQGIGFFLFADKYAALIHELMDKNSTDLQVCGFRKLYDEVIVHMSVHLRRVFLLAALMYVDRFGFDRLMMFALRFEHVLGSFRIAQGSVYWQTSRSCLLDGPLNLLDVIAEAFLSDEVMDYMDSLSKVQKRYDDWDDKVITGVNAPGRYKGTVLAYYKKGEGESLRDKHAWMIDRVQNRCPSGVVA